MFLMLSVELSIYACIRLLPDSLFTLMFYTPLNPLEIVILSIISLPIFEIYWPF